MLEDNFTKCIIENFCKQSFIFLRIFAVSTNSDLK
jgi:hypothetical protein